MPVTEEDIAKVLNLVPAHSTVDGLRETADLQHLSIPEIYEALHILEKRGHVRAEEMFGRNESRA